MKLQREDKSIEKLWDANTTQVTGESEVVFAKKSGVLYRLFKHPKVNGDLVLRQVVRSAGATTS